MAETSLNAGHRHRYTRGSQYTEAAQGHRHRIVARIAVPNYIGGHHHRLSGGEFN